MFYILLHLATWLVWKSVAWRERHTRRGGKKIPIYATGDVVDPIAFSVLTYVWQTHQTSFSVVALFLAIVLTAILIAYWSHDAKRRTHIVSLYNRRGRPTLAGDLHALYVVWVSAIGFSLVLLLLNNELTTVDIQLALTAFSLYIGSVIVDRWRGVI